MRNVAKLDGNLGQNVFINEKRNFISFSLGVNSEHTDKKTGEVTKATNWFKVKAFGEKIVKKIEDEGIRKGTFVSVAGKLKTDGKDQSVFIVASRINKIVKKTEEQRTLESEAKKEKSVKDIEAIVLSKVKEMRDAGYENLAQNYEEAILSVGDFLSAEVYEDEK